MSNTAGEAPYTAPGSTVMLRNGALPGATLMEVSKFFCWWGYPDATPEENTAHAVSILQRELQSMRDDGEPCPDVNPLIEAIAYLWLAHEGQVNGDIEW